MPQPLELATKLLRGSRRALVPHVVVLALETGWGLICGPGSHASIYVEDEELWISYVRDLASGDIQLGAELDYDGVGGEPKGSVVRCATGRMRGDRGCTVLTEFYVDRTRSGLIVSPDFPARTTAPLLRGRPLNLTLIVDKSSIEAFAQDGTVVVTDLIYPTSGNNRIKVFSDGRSAVRVKAGVHALRSIWNQ